MKVHILSLNMRIYSGGFSGSHNLIFVTYLYSRYLPYYLPEVYSNSRHDFLDATTFIERGSDFRLPISTVAS